MPRVTPYLALQIVPAFREIRGTRRLVAMNELSKTRERPKGIPVATLSQIEHGHRIPRPEEMTSLERAYGSRARWYVVELRIIG